MNRPGRITPSTAASPITLMLETPHQTKAAAGPDPAAWLADHGDYLFSYAMLRVRSTEVAEDLVQETLLAALQQQDTFENRSSLRTWLVGILKHKMSDHFRRSATRETRERRAGPIGSHTNKPNEEALRNWLDQQFDKRGKWRKPPARWPDPQTSSPAELDELRAVLADCLDRLPPRACEAILLTERSSMPAEKIGKVLKASTTNVGVLLFRARTALRHCLEVRWFGRKGKDAPSP
jgi:RNA polymerase sigma-70 factor, ECF subfamily